MCNTNLEKVKYEATLASSKNVCFEVLSRTEIKQLLDVTLDLLHYGNGPQKKKYFKYILTSTERCQIVHERLF